MPFVCLFYVLVCRERVFSRLYFLNYIKQDNMISIIIIIIILVVVVINRIVYIMFSFCMELMYNKDGTVCSLRWVVEHMLYY
jgi:hypothetical protein